jgi:YVTN family beta-propeller protein
MKTNMHKLSLPMTMLAAAVALSMHAPARAADASYAVKEHFSLGAPTRWDYTAIDPVRHRLYLSRGTHVQVLQLPSGKPIADIPDTPGVHGFAFAQDLKIGFISNGARDSVTVFDLDSMRATQEIKMTGSNPDALLYEPASQKLFAFNGKSHDVTVIDAKTLAVVATIPTTGRPEFAVSDGAGHVYLNIEDNAGINVIDVASNTMRSQWPLKDCSEPSGLAIDAAHGRLFSTCQNGIMAVTDTATGQRVANVAIGEHPDAAVFDPDTGTIFSSNGGGNGTLTIVHEDDANHYSVVGNVATAKGAKTMAFDHVTKAAYLPTTIGAEFSVIVVGKQ